MSRTAAWARPAQEPGVYHHNYKSCSIRCQSLVDQKQPEKYKCVKLLILNYSWIFRHQAGVVLH